MGYVGHFRSGFSSVFSAINPFAVLAPVAEEVEVDDVPTVSSPFGELAGDDNADFYLGMDFNGALSE